LSSKLHVKMLNSTGLNTKPFLVKQQTKNEIKEHRNNEQKVYSSLFFYKTVQNNKRASGEVGQG